MTAEFTAEAMRLMRERSGGLCEVQWPEQRTWPDWRTADPDKAIEHVRELDGRTWDQYPEAVSP